MASYAHSRRLVGFLIATLLIFESQTVAIGETRHEHTNPLIDLTLIDDSIRIEIRYSTHWNFVGEPIPGYQANRCLLSRPTAEALARVQTEIKKMGYSLLIFDCYRPQRASNFFASWTHNPNQVRYRNIFFPDTPKNKLIEHGYIRQKSSHSNGSSVDLTLVRSNVVVQKKLSRLHFKEPQMDCRFNKKIEQTGQVDMGTTFDCFSPYSGTPHAEVSKIALQNRKLLKIAMNNHGFVGTQNEWWHFTLSKAPHQGRYFDFPIEHSD